MASAIECVRDLVNNVCDTVESQAKLMKDLGHSDDLVRRVTYESLSSSIAPLVNVFKVDQEEPVEEEEEEPVVAAPPVPKRDVTQSPPALAAVAPKGCSAGGIYKDQEKYAVQLSKLRTRYPLIYKRVMKRIPMPVGAGHPDYMKHYVIRRQQILEMAREMMDREGTPVASGSETE